MKRSFLCVWAHSGLGDSVEPAFLAPFACFYKFSPNFLMWSGRAWPANERDSSRRNDCKIASIEYEKIERKDLTMRNDMSTMRMVGARG